MPAPTVSAVFDAALGGGTSTTVTGPPTVNLGDRLIMCVAPDDTQTALTGSTTGSPGWPAGWTELNAGVSRSAGGDISVHAAWKDAGAGDVATGTGVNYTLTWVNGAPGGAIVFRIPSGQFNPAFPPTSTVSLAAAASTSITLTGLTTTVADTLLLAFAATDESAGFTDYWNTPPVAGWTNLVGGSTGLAEANVYLAAASAVQTAPGATGDKVATIRVENDAIAGFLIAVRPPAVASLFTTTPQLTANADDPVSLGTEFSVTSTAWVTHVRYLAPTDVDASTRTMGLYRIDSETSGTLVGGPYTMPTPVGGTWCELALPTPVQVASTGTYRVVVHHSAGGYAATGGYFTTGDGATTATTGAFLVRPNNAVAVGSDQGSYVYGGSLAFPTSSFNGGAYYADVTATDVQPAGGAPVTGSISSSAPSPIASMSAKWSVGTLRNKALLLGLSDGAAITTGNSGGGGQRPFTGVVLSGGATMTYHAATASMSANDVAGGGVSRAEWTNVFVSSLLNVEVKLDAVPSNMGGGDCAFVEVRSASASIARCEIDDVTGRLYVYASTGGSVADSGAVVVSSTGARVSLGIDVAAGTLYPRLYLDEDGESSTPAWSTTVSGAALGSAHASVLRVGQTNSTQSGVVRIEHVRVNDQSSDALGGWPTLPAVLNANAPSPTAAMTGDVQITGSAAGAASVPTADVTVDVAVDSTLDSQTSMPIAAMDAAVVVEGDLFPTTSAPTALIAAHVSQDAELIAAAPAPVATIEAASEVIVAAVMQTLAPASVVQAMIVVEAELTSLVESPTSRVRVIVGEWGTATAPRAVVRANSSAASVAANSSRAEVA